MNIASEFTSSNQSGIILKLAPKYKNDLNLSKYFDVSSFSAHKKEKERLV